MDILLNAINDRQGLAKISLGMAGCMVKRHKHLAGSLANLLNVVLYNGIAAIKPMLGLQPFKYPLGRVTLLLGRVLSSCKFWSMIPVNGPSFGRRRGFERR